MNHRDVRVDWPTSTTAVVLRQRGQGKRATGGPVGVVIWVDYSVTTDRGPIASELLRNLRAVEVETVRSACVRVQENLMLRTRQSAGALQRCSKLRLRPERLLCGAVRRHLANRIVSSHGCDDDVALKDVVLFRAATPVAGLHCFVSAHDVHTPASV